MDHPLHRDLPDLSQDRRPRRIGLLAAAGGFVLLLLAAGVWLKKVATPARLDLPRYGPFPDFVLTDAAGKTIRRTDLLGRIWIANSFPPRCSACAAQMLRMADLQLALERARNVDLVTFVTDPMLMRPAGIAELAREYQVGPARWLLLSGAPLEPAAQFQVIDAAGVVRGHFDEKNPDVSSEILDSVGALLRESRAAR